MSPNDAGIEATARTAARLREEIANLDRVVGLIDEALAEYGSGCPPPIVVHGAGGLLHDFYTGLEIAFAQIAPAGHGAGPRGESWHRELLHGMSLDLRDVRPPVLSPESERGLLAYLKFRHLYRHMYGFRLEWDRVRALCEGVSAVWVRVRAELLAFVDLLDALVSGTR